MLENEMKVMLTEREYNALRPPKNPYTQPFVQKNYYFDTADNTMNKLGITCRIREKDGKYTATVKMHDKQIESFSIEATDFANHASDTSFFGDLNLRSHGFMETERILISWSDGFEVALDKNTYLGITDYELEIEYAEGKKHYATNMLSTLCRSLEVALNEDFDELSFIKKVNRGECKSSRFFKRKRVLENKK